METRPVETTISLIHVVQIIDIIVQQSLVEEDEFIHLHMGVILASVNIPPPNHHTPIAQWVCARGPILGDCM